MTPRAVAFAFVGAFWCVLLAWGLSGCASVERAWHGCDRDVERTAWRGFRADAVCQRVA